MERHLRDKETLLEANAALEKAALQAGWRPTLGGADPASQARQAALEVRRTDDGVNRVLVLSLR